MRTQDTHPGAALALPLPRDLTILTPRCQLRIPSEKDMPSVFSATRHPGFNDGMLWDPPATIEELHEPLRSCIQAWEQGQSYSFTIDGSQGGDFIGRVSIRRTTEPNVWSLGYWTHPDQQGMGYMSEAVQAIVRFGFESLQAERIEAAYATWNVASKKVLERAGLSFVKHLPEGFQKRGQWVAEDRLAITRAAWSAAHETR